MTQQNAADHPALARRPTNVTLPDHLVAEARALRINVSQACEQGLASAVKRVREEAWLAENRQAFDAWNAYIDQHGIPLSEYRRF